LAKQTEASPAPAPVTVLNPGSAESITEEEPTAQAMAARLGPDDARRSPPALRTKDTERNVLVVVRRRGPPYDTKVMRGRIRDGQLIVNARDRRGITLH